MVTREQRFWMPLQRIYLQFSQFGAKCAVPILGPILADQTDNTVTVSYIRRYNSEVHRVGSAYSLSIRRRRALKPRRHLRE
jgi:hypothetical protein